MLTDLTIHEQMKMKFTHPRIVLKITSKIQKGPVKLLKGKFLVLLAW